MLQDVSPRGLSLGLGLVTLPGFVAAAAGADAWALTALAGEAGTYSPFRIWGTWGSSYEIVHFRGTKACSALVGKCLGESRRKGVRRKRIELRCGEFWSLGHVVSRSCWAISDRAMDGGNLASPRDSKILLRGIGYISLRLIYFIHSQIVMSIWLRFGM